MQRRLDDGDLDDGDAAAVPRDPTQSPEHARGGLRGVRGPETRRLSVQGLWAGVAAEDRGHDAAGARRHCPTEAGPAQDRRRRTFVLLVMTSPVRAVPRHSQATRTMARSGTQWHRREGLARALRHRVHPSPAGRPPFPPGRPSVPRENCQIECRRAVRDSGPPARRRHGGGVAPRAGSHSGHNKSRGVHTKLSLLLIKPRSGGLPALPGRLSFN